MHLTFRSRLTFIRRKKIYYNHALHRGAAKNNRTLCSMKEEAFLIMQNIQIALWLRVVAPGIIPG